MPNRMELPDDLQSLIEKREAERRESDAAAEAKSETESATPERRERERRASDPESSSE